MYQVCGVNVNLVDLAAPPKVEPIKESQNQMVSNLALGRPVTWMPELDFGRLMGRVLSASRPLQSAEHLRGRDEQLKIIRQATFASGRHVFIHGYRGVGKTSLGQTAAFELQHSNAEPILIGCSKNSTLTSVVRDIFENGIKRDPRVAAEKIKKGGGFGIPGVSGDYAKELERGVVPDFRTLNECVNALKVLTDVHSPKPIVLIDEFDKITDEAEQELFADFIKQVSDQHLEIVFIFCGIGESIDKIIKAHPSSHRYFQPIKLDRLGFEPRLEIINNSADTLGVEIDDTSRYRIARISDGFPHYIHLLCEKLYWIVYEEKNGGKVTPVIFEKAMSAASDSMEPELKRPYEQATRKYTNNYEEILFAAADGHEMHRRSSDIYASYMRIMALLKKEPLPRDKFNACMNNLKKAQYAEILMGTRQGWYEYREKVIRGYARLRAEQRGVNLDHDHPNAPRGMS